MSLKDEITNDPLAIGYAGMTDQQVMDSLNAEKTLDHETLAASQIYEAIDKTEFDALAADQKADIDRILSLSGEIPIGSNSKARAVLAGAFDGASTTRPALLALATYSGSRGIEIGFGYVNIGDVAQARA